MELFVPTSVKEAQESRRLGENVKLLTYITIFYLSLAFYTISLQPPSKMKDKFLKTM
jgi:hypothetical protein